VLPGLIHSPLTDSRQGVLFFHHQCIHNPIPTAGPAHNLRNPLPSRKTWATGLEIPAEKRIEPAGLPTDRDQKCGFWPRPLSRHQTDGVPRDPLVGSARRDLLVRSVAPGARIHPNSAGTTSVPLRFSPRRDVLVTSDAPRSIIHSASVRSNCFQ